MFITAFLAGLCCFHLSSGATHSMQYFYTASSGISDFPEFVVVGMVNGNQFVHYDSNSKKAVPKQDWISKNEGSQYWETETGTFLGTSQTYKANIDICKQRFNQTGGVHTLMRMFGCQWNDETGTVDAFDNWGYDGEDFVSFDLKNMRSIATKSESLITKHKWDSDKGFLESERHYFTQICPEWLKKYLQYGRSTFERKVAPEVNLLQKDSEVVCHSTGFYPDGIMITWKRDGEEEEDVIVGETLPNEDGTFQKRAVLTVSPEQRKKGQYTCEVDHKSGPTIVKTLIVEDDLFSGGNSLGIIIGCVVAAVIVIGVIAAIVVMMKRKDYKKAEQSDSDSDASCPARA